MLQSKVEYIQAFRTNAAQQRFNLEVSSQKVYSLSDKQGPYRLLEVGQMAAEGIRGRETMVFPIRGVMPRKGMQWKLGKDEVSRLDASGRLIMQGNKPMVIYRPGDEDESSYMPFWSHFLDKDVYGTAESGLDEVRSDLGFGRVVETVKPTRLIAKLLFHVANKSHIVLDFFAGSGTTAHAVINLNRADGGKRKYILVEMGEHFNTVILPRVKKVVFSDKWKDGKAQTSEVSKTSEVSHPRGISHFCKYYELEQYEDTLRRASYQDAPLLQGVDPYTSYVFLRDLKMLDAISLDKQQNRVDVHPEKLYDGIDLAETLSCVTGKWIKRITRDTVTFEDGTTASLTNPDWTLIKPLVWW
jgi:adenine-specific DNA-methyltransferase